MAITLPTDALIMITGLPGHGKTLFAVDMALKFNKEGVRTFCWGLDGASTDLFEVLPDDWDFKDWQSLPAGSVVFFDEAHKILPMRGSNAGSAPKHIQDLTEIRHHGLRFVFITQDPRNMDVFVRRLIARHYHVTRKMGFAGARITEFDKCQDDTSDYHANKYAITHLFKYPKELYKYYTSSTMHLVKKNIPKKFLIVLILGIAGLSFLGWVGWKYANRLSDGNIISGTDVVPEDKKEGEGSYFGSVGSAGRSEPTYKTIQEYVDVAKPLSPVAPWTAPIYAEARKVQKVPGKPLCMIGSKGCRCWSEQMVRIKDIPDLICRDIVMNGVENPYGLPYAENSGGGRAEGQVGPAPAPNSPPNNSVVIASSSDTKTVPSP